MDGSFSPGRRSVLRNMAFAPAAAALGATLWQDKAWADTAANLPDVDPRVHFLKRTSFGIRPADLAAIGTQGENAYLEQQFTLDPNTDPAHLLAQVQFPIAHLNPTAYWRAVFPSPEPSQGGDIALHWPLIAAQVVGNALYRALFSKRQLFEVMVQFWSNHLNTNEPHFKGSEQQTVIRAHAFGNFRNLIRASQRDTAMGRYLNNDNSKAPTPNQNYARELLELHTMGEGRGYDQADVITLADILSGHTWDMNRQSQTFGQYLYRPEWHVNVPVGGQRIFLGREITARGQGEIDQAINFILDTRECVEFIAFKLCRHFVSDVPDHINDIVPGDFVSRTADELRRVNFDIKSVLRFILRSPEFRASADQKFMRPMEFGIGMLRAYDVQPTEVLPNDITGALQEIFVNQYGTSNPNLANNVATAPIPLGVTAHLVRFLRDTGHLPGHWPTPDGYPDVGSFWASATQFITRWNYVAAESERDVAQDTVLLGTPLQSNPQGNTRASRRVPNTAMPARTLVRLLADLLLHRSISEEDEVIVARYISGNQPERLLTAAQVKLESTYVATILLSSPYAQLR